MESSPLGNQSLFIHKHTQLLLGLLQIKIILIHALQKTEASDLNLTRINKISFVLTHNNKAR